MEGPLAALAAAAAKHGSRAGKLHLVLTERLRNAPPEVLRPYELWLRREARQAAHLAFQVLERGGIPDQEMAALRSTAAQAAHRALLRRRAEQMALPRFGPERPVPSAPAPRPAPPPRLLSPRRKTATRPPLAPRRETEDVPARLPATGDPELDQAFQLMETGVLRLKSVAEGLDALDQLARALWQFRLAALGA
jgi:hypothetical protein